MGLFSNLFENKNKKKLRAVVDSVIDECEKNIGFSPSSRSIIHTELEKIMQKDFKIDGVSFLNGGIEFNFINAAYTLCYSIAFNKLATGQYCLMGTLVNTMPGPALMKVVEHTSEWAVKNGLMFPEKREEDLKWLRQTLRNLG